MPSHPLSLCLLSLSWQLFPELVPVLSALHRACRIEDIQQLPTPTCIKDLGAVLGMVNFVRRFVEKCAEIMSPLVELTRKDFARKTR